MKIIQKVLLAVVLIFSTASIADDDYFTLGMSVPILDWDSCFTIYCDEDISRDVLFGYGQSLGDRGFFWEADGFTSVFNGRIDGQSYRVNGLGGHVGWRSPSRFYFTARVGMAYTDIDGPSGHDISGSRTAPVIGIGFGVKQWTIFEHRRYASGINTLTASYRFK